MPDDLVSDDALARLLADTAAPIYAVDADRTIAFANLALADWLGLEVPAVLGRRVEYHADAPSTVSGGLLTGLCPSPEAFAGREGVGTISSVGRDGGLRRRRARFVPLAPADRDGGCPVLVVGEQADLTAAQLAELVSGGSPDGLHAAIRKFRSERAATTPLALLGDALPTVQLRARFDAAANSGCNAIVVGGTAADRHELAEALHDRPASRRPQHQDTGRLVAIDATLADQESIDETLRSLEQAGGDATLLLGEVDAMPTDLQGTVAERVRTTKVARVLATVSEPDALLAPTLEAVVGTVTLQLPPLSERRADLPLLVQWFIEQQNIGADQQVAGIADDAMELLAGYPFRGVEQLQSFVTQSHEACRGPLIERGDLPPVVEQAGLAAELSQEEEPVDLDKLLADVEREVVTRALNKARDNKAEAARLLGLTRQRFYRLLERHGMLPTEGQNP